MEAWFEALLAALAMPNGVERAVTGEWPGRILREPAGAGGFGYDPIFQPDGHEVSAAELPADVKNAQSHRAIAFAALGPVLTELLG